MQQSSKNRDLSCLPPDALGSRHFPCRALCLWSQSLRQGQENRPFQNHGIPASAAKFPIKMMGFMQTALILCKLSDNWRISRIDFIVSLTFYQVKVIDSNPLA
ncbi:MAG: hypothetical protein Q4A63_01350 [Butyricicoccus pullicaecorum]|nr:hypothetical protein [Butyricicoccus pullicaecorum]